MKAAKLNAERGYEHVRVENEGLAQALTKAEEAARYYEQSAADSAMEASREKVRAEGEIARREYLQRYAAAEQESRHMKRSFDQRRQEARGAGSGAGAGWFRTTTHSPSVRTTRTRIGWAKGAAADRKASPFWGWTRRLTRTTSVPRG